jgi:hypothetical protein
MNGSIAPRLRVGLVAMLVVAVAALGASCGKTGTKATGKAPPEEIKGKMQSQQKTMMEKMGPGGGAVRHGGADAKAGGG